MYKLQIPLLAFYSGELYRRAVHRWSGTGFPYLLALLAITWLLVAARVYTALLGLETDAEFRQLVDQIPRVEIEQGTVSAEVEQPYIIRDPNDPSFVFVIDTTGEITEIGPEVEKGGLLTRDRLVMKRSRWETREFDLSQVETFWIDAERVIAWVQPVAAAAAVLVALAMPFLGLIYRIVLAQLLAAVGQLAGKAFSVPLDWPALLRVAAVAMTPAIVLDTVVLVFMPSTATGCGWWLVCGAINVGYMVFGVASNRRSPTTAFDAAPPPPPVGL